MKTIKIESKAAVVIISTYGAEVISFRSKAEDREYIWQGDEELWGYHTPILFPITGKIKNDTYRYQGELYHMSSHGFARNSLFTIKKVKKNEVTLELVHNRFTRKQYPFLFALAVTYRVQEYRLDIAYSIRNVGVQDLPFMFGIHPAFQLPIDNDKKIEDYILRFSQAQQMLDGNPILDFFRVTNNHRQRIFFFNRDIISDYVELADGVNGIRVGITGYETLGFWRKNNNAGFLCIEPWHPVNTLQKVHFFDSPYDCNILGSKKTFACDYYIEIIKEKRRKFNEGYI